MSSGRATIHKNALMLGVLSSRRDAKPMRIVQPLYYLPTMYLKKGNFIGSTFDRRSMIQLLKGHGAEDHYYVEEGQRQPQDAVGIPLHIAASERRRRQHEENIERK
jgi:hypothetical protein